MIRANLDGAFYFCRAVADQMVFKQRSGRIVNVSSVAAEHTNPGQANYAASKGAINAFTKSLALHAVERGIRVNAIAPALMLPSGEQGEANFAEVHDLNPLRRGIEVDDVVAALRFLIDSKGVTGQTIGLDAGQRFMSLPRDVQFLER